MLVDAKLMIDGKELKTQIEIDEKDLKTVQDKKRTGYERVDPEACYYFNSKELKKEKDMRYGIDDLRFTVADYYSSKKVAENNARADQLMRQLRRFAVENRKEEIDWDDSIQPKFCIIYDNHINRVLCSDSRYIIREFNAIYFDSEETVKDAISKFYDELIWYFTEYKDSL